MDELILEYIDILSLLQIVQELCEGTLCVHFNIIVSDMGR